MLNNRSYFEKPAETCMAAFRGTSALAGEESFDLPIVRFPYSSAFPESIFEAMRAVEQGEKMRKAFAAEPPTFGTAFFVAALDDSPKDAMLTLLGGRAEALAKLPRDRQLRIAALAKAVMTGNQKGKSDLIAKGKEWLDHLDEKEILDGIEKFVAIKKASDLNPSGRAYGREVLKSLNILTKTQPDTAVRYFLKAREQVAADRKAGTQNDGNNEGYQENNPMDRSLSVLGAALTGAVDQANSAAAAGDPRIPKTIAAFAEMVAAPDGCGVELNRSLSTSLGSLLIKAGTPPEKDAPFSVQRLVESVGPVLKPEWLPALLGPVRAAMWTSETKKNADAQSWLEQQSKDGPHRDFATLLLTAARISRQEKDADNVQRTGVLATDKLPPEQQWLISQFEKKSVPPAALAGFAAESLRAWPAAEPPLRYACAQALAAAWSADVPVSEEYADLIVESLTLLGTNHVLPQDEALKAAAKALAEAWLKEIDRPFTNNGSFYGWPDTSLQDRLLLRRMMYLALASGHPAEAGKMAKAVASGGSYNLTPAWPGIMVFFRHFDGAKALLKQSPRGFYNYDKDGKRIGWDYKAGVHEALPDFLASIESPVERYRAEVILRGLPDIDSEGIGGPLKGKVENRDGRLLALAKAWPGEEVLKLPDGMMLLARLLAVPGSETTLAPVLEKIAKGKPLVSWLPGDSSDGNTRDIGAVLGSIIRREVADGRPEVLLGFCQDVFGTRRNNYLPYANAGILGAVWHHCMEGVRNNWPKWDEPVRKKIRDLGREMLLDSQLRNSLNNEVTDGLAHLYLQTYWLALASGELKEFQEKLSGRLKSEAPWINDYVRRLDVAKGLALLPQPWPDDNAEAAQKRSELMLSWILSGAELPGHYVDGGTWFHRVIKAGWLRTDDVLAKAEDLATKRERSGTTAPELLEIATEAKREDVVTKVLALMKTAAEKDATGMAILKLTDAWQHRDHLPEALAALDLLTPERLKRKEVTDYVRKQSAVKRVQLRVKIAEREKGIDEAMKLTTALLTESPEDPAVWAGLAWAWDGLTGSPSVAGNHEEALRRSSFALILSNATDTFSKGSLSTPAKACRSSVETELKALNRDPKLADELRSPAGITQFLDDPASPGKSLPDAARKKVLDLAEAAVKASKEPVSR